MKRILDIIFRVLNYIFIAIMILYLASYFYNRMNNIEAKPNVLGFQVYVDVTNSMDPYLHVNDLIIIKSCKQKDIKVGDIITFRENASTVTHRVIDIVKKGKDVLYKTKGDNNNSEDDRLISFSEVEGKYFFKICYLGIFITDKILLILLIVAILIISFIYYNRSYFVKGMVDIVSDESDIDSVDHDVISEDAYGEEVSENSDIDEIEIIGNEDKKENIKDKKNEKVVADDKKSKEKDDVEIEKL